MNEQEALELVEADMAAGHELAKELVRAQEQDAFRYEPVAFAIAILLNSGEKQDQHFANTDFRDLVNAWLSDHGSNWRVVEVH